jgi:hypothetical protein
MALDAFGRKKTAFSMKNAVFCMSLDCFGLRSGAEDRNRTGTGGLVPTDFKSVVSTYFTTPATNTILLGLAAKLTLSLRISSGIQPRRINAQAGRHAGESISRCFFGIRKRTRNRIRKRGEPG